MGNRQSQSALHNHGNQQSTFSGEAVRAEIRAVRKARRPAAGRQSTLSRMIHLDTSALIAAASIYRRLKRRRHREIDLAVAACAILQNAAL